MILVTTAALLLGCVDRGASADSCAPGRRDACFERGLRQIHSMPPEFDLAAAAASFDLACGDGHLGACVELGQLVQHGRGVPWDSVRALSLFQRACDGGYGPGCQSLGLMVRQGNGTRPDEPRAHDLIQRAIDLLRDDCDGRRPEGCVSLGYLLETGFGVTLPDPIEAGRVYERGCAAGDADACAESARVRIDRASGDISLEIERMQKACERSARACGLLGQLRWNRRHGLPREPALALDLVRRGCEGGDGQSCLALGVLLSLGEEIEADPAGAEGAYQRACLLGFADGCRMAAEIAQYRYQRTGDLREAQALAEQLGTGCRVGDAEACTALGAILRSETLGASDPVSALTAFTEGCRRLDFDACAEVVSAGAPLPLVEPAASEFLAGACARGLSAACVGGVRPTPGEDPRRSVPSP